MQMRMILKVSEDWCCGSDLTPIRSISGACGEKEQFLPLLSTKQKYLRHDWQLSHHSTFLYFHTVNCGQIFPTSDFSFFFFFLFFPFLVYKYQTVDTEQITWVGMVIKNVGNIHAYCPTCFSI